MACLKVDFEDCLLVLDLVLEVDGTVLAGSDVGEVGAWRVVVGEEGEPETWQDVGHEVVDFGSGPVLHHIPHDQQVSTLSDFLQSLDNVVLPVVLRLPL